MSCVFEIICLGNELLIGKTLNTNGQWLARYITNLGGKVRRIIVAGDDISEISSVVNESLARRPAFIVSTGGLGPTFDDKTIEAVAMALGKAMELNEEAFRMVKEKYHQYETVIHKKIDLSPARLKMARLPKDAVPLPNPIGTAPSVLTEHVPTKIVCLPGVPSEMKAIFEESVVPLIKRCVGELFYYEESFESTGIIESELAPLIDEVMRENPYVYVKSNPKAAEPIPLIKLLIFTSSPSKEEAKNRVKAAGIQISRLIVERGGRIKPFTL